MSSLLMRVVQSICCPVSQPTESGNYGLSETGLPDATPDPGYDVSSIHPVFS